jgi:hypothetical protein
MDYRANTGGLQEESPAGFTLEPTKNQVRMKLECYFESATCYDSQSGLWKLNGSWENWSGKYHCPGSKGL